MSTLVLVAALLFQDAKAADEAVKEFTAAFNKKGASEAERIAAVKALAATHHDETSKVLARVLGCGQPAVSIEAAKELAAFTDVRNTAARVAPYLFEKVNVERTALRIEIGKCLGALKDPAGLPTLHKALRDRDLLVAKEVIEQLAVIRRKESVPVLIEYLKLCEYAPSSEMLVQLPIQFDNPNDQLQQQWNFSIAVSADDYQRMRKATLHEPLLKALRDLTKEKWETYRGWRDWWAASGARFEIAKE